MGFKTLGDIRAYRAARALKLEIYRLVKAHQAAYDDHRFRSQLFEAAASVEMNIVEGFRRYSAGEFAHFLRIARASLEEATSRIQDGIDRAYFTEAACKTTFELAGEAGRLIMGLVTSLRPFVSPRRTSGPPPPKR
jgi:four helix bundle protein